MEIVPGFLSARSVHGQIEFSLRSDRCLHYSAWTMCLLTFSNVLFSCFFSIHCTQVLPTVSYVACYKGHERLAVFSSIFLALSLVVLFLAAHIRFFELVSCVERTLMLVLGLLIVGTIPVVFIIDELNGLYFAPIDFVHSYVLFSLLVLCMSWVYLAYGNLSDLKPSFSSREVTDLHSLWNWIMLTLFMLVFTLVEWQVGYSIYSNWIVNESVFAICEWVTLVLAVFLPEKFCKVFGDLRVSVAVQDGSKKESDDDEGSEARPDRYFSLAS